MSERISNRMLDEIRVWMSEDVPISKRRWFEDKNLSVYLRSYTVGGAKILDLANVSAKVQGQGVYSHFLGALIVFAIFFRYDKLKIENVLEERFQKYHEGLNFKSNRDSPPSYILELDDVK